MNTATGDNRTRILIVDDHASVRAGLRFLLSGETDFEVAGEAYSVATALSAIEELAPDIIVLDFGLGAENSDRVLEALAGRPHAPRVLMLSMEDVRVVGQELQRRGIDAYVMKQAPTTDILAALRRIRDWLLSAQAQAEPANRPTCPESEAPSPAPVHLTKREREVLSLVKTGMPSKSIARRLRISAKTVDVHKHQLRRKLGLRNEQELIRHAGLFSADDTDRPV